MNIDIQFNKETKPYEFMYLLLSIFYFLFIFYSTMNSFIFFNFFLIFIFLGIYFLFLFIAAQSAGAVEYSDCFSAERWDSSPQCPGYDTKKSDGEVSVIVELWGMWSTASL